MSSLGNRLIDYLQSTLLLLSRLKHQSDRRRLYSKRPKYYRRESTMAAKVYSGLYHLKFGLCIYMSFITIRISLEINRVIIAGILKKGMINRMTMKMSLNVEYA
jgi:hypothetical protein